MIWKVPTWVLSVVGITFGLLHAVFGILWIRANGRPELVIFSLGLYLLALIPSGIVRGSRELPIWQTWLNAVICAVIPIAINSNLDPMHLGDYATWYVLGIGTILGITAVRGRRLFAWVGFVILVAEIAVWGGVGSLASTGLPGVLSLVITGHAVSKGVESAVKAARELNLRAAALAAETAAVETAGRVRARLLEKTLRSALPSLSLIAALGGDLNESQRKEALLLEAGLRDEIRGAALLNDQMRAAISQARKRGVEVLVLDEGGLDGLAETEISGLLAKAAESIEGVCEGRLTIRAPKGERWRITVAAVRAGQSQPDLWLKLGETANLPAGN